MSLKVIQPGILSLLQDGGRTGQQRIGLTNGGPLDRRAFDYCNRLLGNAKNCTLLEISFGGLHLQALVDTFICITGAKLPLHINGKEQPQWQVLPVAAGDEIQLEFAEQGCRAYLGVADGFTIPPSFGSSATVMRENIGGLHGDKLQAGDNLPCSGARLAVNYCLNEADRPVYGDPARLLLVPGYQQAAFDPAQQWRFFNSEYRLTERCDRMGFRLEGETVHSNIVGMLSEGICHGAIQIPADGQPIVLMNDRQTIGGYPKIGSVIPRDTARLSQLSPGSQVYFEAISIEQAHNIHCLEQARFRRTPVQPC